MVVSGASTTMSLTEAPEVNDSYHDLLNAVLKICFLSA